MSAYHRLLSPGRIGSLSLRNRIIVAAMGVNLAEEDGSCGEAIRAFHARQAEGGAGLIVVGSAGVSWPAGGNEPRQVAISEDRHVAGVRALADAVHAHGSKLALQLHHGGLSAVEDRAAGRPVMVPSYPEPAAIDMPELMLESEMAEMYGGMGAEVTLQPMTHDDIRTLVQHFADAARRAREAGVDGVEIHAGHGYIISGFLSPYANRRDDEYGGSLENRARLLLEVIAAVREAVGRAYPVWIKLDAQEYGKPEGISLADAIETARLAEAAGVDAIAVSAYHDVGQGALHSESNIPHTPGQLLPAAAAFRAALSIPVIATGRVEPAQADKGIGAGRYDFVAMGRKLLADPDLPRKLGEDRAEAVRPCVYCYCCVSQIYLRRSVKCAVNPETGRERERALVTTSAARHVAVIGGGPAGMEAALRLSRRGHRVTLLEASDRLGGTLAFAGIAYPANLRLLDWLRREIELSAVTVRLSTAATVELLRRLDADDVVVATGARRDMPAIPGADRDFVFSGEEMRALVSGDSAPGLRRKTSALTRGMAWLGSATRLSHRPQVLRQVSRAWMPLAKEIVIVGSELVGLELAEYLAERGRRVTVLDEAARPGKGLYLVRRMRLLRELRELGVTVLKRAGDIVIEDAAVSYTNFRGQRRRIAAGHVIVAQGASAELTLAEALREAGFTVHSIGDCNGVGYIEGAMEDAAELALRIA
jgi:2,4-dienoyl-CoA reductase-like NADH-dependent reductase (Old Yellow Enzyme family)/NADPH-dependent 2,4-dienoyl-CoA reductase/sulfur reductase-like enzyme